MWYYFGHWLRPPLRIRITMQLSCLRAWTTFHDTDCWSLSLLDWQMQSLSGVPHQGDGGPGARPLCAADAGAVHRLLAAPGASNPAGTPHPTQPHPRDFAAGLETHTPQQQPATLLYAASVVAVNCGCNNWQTPLGGYTVSLSVICTRTWINTPWLQWFPDIKWLIYKVNFKFSIWNILMY